MFIRRYVTFVLVIITLHSHCIVLLCSKKIEVDRQSLNQFDRVDFKLLPTFMVNFGYPYNDLVICKDSPDYQM